MTINKDDVSSYYVKIPKSMLPYAENQFETLRIYFITNQLLEYMDDEHQEQEKQKVNTSIKIKDILVNPYNKEILIWYNKYYTNVNTNKIIKTEIITSFLTYLPFSSDAALKNSIVSKYMVSTYIEKILTLPTDKVLDNRNKQLK